MIAAGLLPPDYRWIAAAGPLPRMLDEGLRLFGTREGEGVADNPVILGWAREVGGGLARTYRADAVPWCGLFLAVIAVRAGKSLPDAPLWALSWSRFGVAADRPMLGDVLTFTRPGGGHVGLYVGEDADAYHVLGGNQGDRVGFARIARARMRAARRPAYRWPPASVTARLLSPSGALSTDEA